MTDALLLVHMAAKRWTSDTRFPHDSLLVALVGLALVCFVLPVMLLLLRHLLVVFGLLVHLGVGTFPTGLLGSLISGNPGA